MKYSIGIVTTVILFTAFIMSGCDRPSNEMQDTETTVTETNRDLDMENNEVDAELRTFRTENAERFKELNRTKSEIREQIRNESDSEVKNRLELRLEELEETQRELKREMDNYKASGKDNWDNFKDSFSDRMDDLGDSLDDFFSTTNNN